MDFSMFKKEKYDLIFSIGEVCFCSTVLRKCNLQNVSYPFDWNGAVEFYKKCVILANRFERFFEKEDLEYMTDYMCEDSFAYRNKYNGMIFNHDFFKSMSFDEAYTLAKEKYDKRTKRLLNHIENADSVLAVFMEAPIANHADIPDEEIIKGHQMLQEAFGIKINTLYVKNSLTENTKTKLADGLTKIVFDYRNLDDKTGLYPDQKKLKKILKNYRANLPLSYRLKHRIIKILINFIPNKSTRAKIRNKYHIY